MNSGGKFCLSFCHFCSCIFMLHEGPVRSGRLNASIVCFPPLSFTRTRQPWELWTPLELVSVFSYQLALQVLCLVSFFFFLVLTRRQFFTALREGNIDERKNHQWVASHPYPGQEPSIEPSNLVCVLAGNQSRNLWVRGRHSNQLSHPAWACSFLVFV